MSPGSTSTTPDVVPPAARLVRDLVNTYEPQTGLETWTSGAALRTWFVEQGLLPHGTDEGGGRRDDVGSADLATAVTVREGLRHVLLAHAGHEPDPAAIAALNAALETLSVRAEFGPDGYRLRAASPGPTSEALGRVLDLVRAATEDGSWSRLKVCARDSCRWAYYDASRNQVRRWCSMAGCGNSVKMRRAATARKARALRDVRPEGR